MIWQRRHSLAHRDMRIAQMPVDQHRQDDPWMRPSLFGASILIIYFLWQFAR